jgi:aryl sulfotransferase
VTRTIWLASYPKSGNTWMRLLIANASIPIAGPVNINNIPDGGIASDRRAFDNMTLIDSSLLSHDEIDCLRPRVYSELALDNVDTLLTDRPRVQFVKVHDAYAPNVQGEPLLGGGQSADGAIIIVRDPRAIATSCHYLDE